MDKILAPQVSACMIVPDWQGLKPIHHCTEVLRLLDGDRMLELFGGGGRVVLHSLAKHRWWNDNDPSLYRVAVAIRDDVDKFAERCRRLPMDDEGACNKLWDAIRNTDRSEWSTEHLVFGATATLGARFSGRAHIHHNWQPYLKRLHETSSLLQGVRLTCMDWQDATAEAEADGWNVYADPPYWKDNARKEAYFSSSVDLDLLYQRLSTFRALVSGYHAPDSWLAMNVTRSRMIRKPPNGIKHEKQYNFISPRLASEINLPATEA